MFVVLPLRISATQRLPDTRPAKGRVSFVQTVDTTQSVTLEILAEDWQRSLPPATWMRWVWKIRSSRYRGYGLVAMRRPQPVQ
jgi:hypothetical protein